jgi:outer membrane biosynthesis protein TonB
MKPYLISLGIHLLLLIVLLFHHTSIPKKIHPKPIVERTFVAVAPTPLKEIAIVEPKKETSVAPESIKPPAPKNESPPKKKPSAPKKSDPVQTTSEQAKKERKAAVLKKLKEAETLASSNHVPTASNKTSHPSTITLESEKSVRESAFESILMTFLQDHLKLPEAGFVRIQLTLSNQGVFKKLKVINSNSIKNRLYVESILSQLSYPSFEGENEKCFQLMLENC